MATKKPFYRNPVACSALLKKGGVHTQSKSGVRARNKQSLQWDIDEWMDANEEQTNQEQKNQGVEGEQSPSDQSNRWGSNSIFTTRFPISSAYPE